MTDFLTFELRLLTPTGERVRVGPIGTHAEASALARSYLGDGRARRVEIFARQHGRWSLVGVIGLPQRAPTGPTDDGVDLDDDAPDRADE